MTKLSIQQADARKQAAPKSAPLNKQMTQKPWQATFIKRLPTRIGTPLSCDTGGCSST